MVSRQYVAETLNKALKVSSYNQGNVIGVSAMEGIGLSSECCCRGLLGTAGPARCMAA